MYKIFIWVLFYAPLYVSAQGVDTLDAPGITTGNKDMYEYAPKGSLGIEVPVLPNTDGIMSNYNQYTPVYENPTHEHINSTSNDVKRELDELGKKTGTRSMEHSLQPVSYDPIKTNSSRFINSPCYSELGFDPFMDVQRQEKIYNICEEGKRDKIIKNTVFMILKTIGIIALLGLLCLCFMIGLRRYY